MYINPERCAQVIFSDPDYQMLDAFIVRKGNPKNLHDYKDVVEAKAKFATGTGYAEIQYAVEAGYKESDILIVPDQVAGLNAVEAGRVDVFAGTALTTREVVKKSRKAETHRSRSRRWWTASRTSTAAASRSGRPRPSCGTPSTWSCRS